MSTTDSRWFARQIAEVVEAPPVPTSVIASGVSADKIRSYSAEVEKRFSAEKALNNSTGLKTCAGMR